MHSNYRIIHIVTQMEAGGAQKGAIQLCEAFIRRGYPSEVWFLYKKRPTYPDRPYVRWLWDHKPRTSKELLGLWFKLYQWLRLAAPTGVITYTHYANILGQTAAWLAGIPHRLATQHNSSWTYPRVACWLDLVIGSVGLYTANIFVSASVGRSFQSYPRPYRRRSQVVVNGLRPLEFSGSKQEARLQLGLPTDRCIAVNVGRLAYQKNQQLLIKAMSRISSSQCLLVIAGDGELRADLEHMINCHRCADRVQLLGELPPQHIGALLVASDMFVFPSHYEGLSFAMVEAMMAGLPVIASDIEAHRDIVGDAGILLPIDDPNRWQETIQTLANDERLRAELGARAYQRSVLYDLDRMVDNYLALLLRSNS